MRITFKLSGGIAHFPGLAAPKTIDVDALPDARQQEIRRAVSSSKFFEQPAAQPPRRGAADYQTYTIEIADGDRLHTVVVSDPVPPDLQPLIALLTDLTSR